MGGFPSHKDMIGRSRKDLILLVSAMMLTIFSLFPLIPAKRVVCFPRADPARCKLLIIEAV